MTECPLCGSSPASLDGCTIDCPRCGRVYVKDSHPSDIKSGWPNWLGDWTDARSVHRRSRLSHLLRRGAKLSTKLRLDDPLPSPAEQLDSLVLWLGEHLLDPAASVQIPMLEVDAWIGAGISRGAGTAGLSWLLRQEETIALLEPQPLRLKMKGWERFYALKRGRVESRKAFMAMKFGARDVELTYKNCFRPAVALAGFELFDMQDQQRAGMIDDHMRVAIRNSRFVIADLSDECRGSYWESGFAEGLGRPVIYTCKAGKWDEERSHFDTNHLATVVWDVNNLDKAAKVLTAIVRNTLPDEAKMED